LLSASFSPWVKKEADSNVDLIKQAYGYTEQKAREVLNILRPEDIKAIKKSMDTGGTR
jgi:flavorubredoxin